MSTRIRIGGLMRCCVLTIEAEDRRERPIEGKEITCDQCGERLRFRAGAWEWAHEPFDGPR